MDEFTVGDLENYTVEVIPITFKGKQAYARALTFDGQMAVGNKFKGKLGDEASPDDLRFMVACLLCNAEGELMFDSPEKGAALLKKLSSEDMLELIDQTNKVNGQDIEHEKKSLSQIR